MRGVYLEEAFWGDSWLSMCGLSMNEAQQGEGLWQEYPHQPSLARGKTNSLEEVELW